MQFRISFVHRFPVEFLVNQLQPDINALWRAKGQVSDSVMQQPNNRRSFACWPTTSHFTLCHVTHPFWGEGSPFAAAVL